MNNSKKQMVLVVASLVILLIGVITIGSVIGAKSGGDPVGTGDVDDNTPKRTGKTLEELTKKLSYSESELIKAPINFGDKSNLYDELPDIEKYPLVVEGNGQVDIEIFTSGEKGGTDFNSWLVRVADSFNRAGYTTASGRSASMSVRSVASGLGADYIISGKSVPDLWTPSNELFGNYAIAQGGKIELLAPRTVGNTAGVLIRKDLSYKDMNAVIDVVNSGKFNLGYTNPQSSAAGINTLLYLLKTFGSGDIESETAIEAFSSFNNNIPFIAYTTQQMIDSALGGGLDGMISEYQAYINSEAMKSEYNFFPFGQRHDNPLYIVDKSHKSEDEIEVINLIKDYMLNAESQKIATDYGFNALDDYKSDIEVTGTEIVKALDIYKTRKDSGRDIIAVFVADCSGSMSGEGINSLKESLTNGLQYINDNNYVGLISYSSDIRLEVPIGKFDLTQKSYFQGAINNLNAMGGTHSYEAVCVGLSLIEQFRQDKPDAKCMLFLLSDGQAGGNYKINTIEQAVIDTSIPIYTIGYTSEADMKELQALSNINEAASIQADTDNIVYTIKSLFNAQL